jgi:hypothetical protein
MNEKYRHQSSLMETRALGACNILLGKRSRSDMQAKTNNKLPHPQLDEPRSAAFFSKLCITPHKTLGPPLIRHRLAETFPFVHRVAAGS